MGGERGQRPRSPVLVVNCPSGGEGVGVDGGLLLGGQGISTGFKVLENLGMSRWNLDFIVMEPLSKSMIRCANWRDTR